MAKWRDIWSNRIQTWEEKVWLWDNKIGLSVLVDVPSRPWRNIDNDFTMWCRCEYDETGAAITPQHPRPPSKTDEVMQALQEDVGTPADDVPF